jgi:hypothetical protein
VADAQDAAILRRTAYGSELNVDQADEMVAPRIGGWSGAKRRSTKPRNWWPLARLRRLLAGARGRPGGGAAGIERGGVARAIDPRIERYGHGGENYIDRLAHSPAEAAELAAGYTADGAFIYAAYAKVEVAFRERFGKPMPVSAMGETAVHRAMGFDHRGRVDVAINPDQPEGVWLIEYLKQNHIPFFAFRGPVKGKATGAHIHIGPMSTRLPSGG